MNLDINDTWLRHAKNFKTMNRQLACSTLDFNALSCKFVQTNTVNLKSRHHRRNLRNFANEIFFDNTLHVFDTDARHIVSRGHRAR